MKKRMIAATRDTKILKHSGSGNTVSDYLGCFHLIRELNVDCLCQSCRRMRIAFLIHRTHLEHHEVLASVEQFLSVRQKHNFWSHEQEYLPHDLETVHCSRVSSGCSFRYFTTSSLNCLSCCLEWGIMSFLLVFFTINIIPQLRGILFLI